MDEKQAKELVQNLIDASYDTGYYSGKGEDGMYHHLSAINAREDLRNEVIHHLTNQSTRPHDAERKTAHCPECGKALSRCICNKSGG